MKALGDKRPDEKDKQQEKTTCGVSPGLKKLSLQHQNPPAQENFDESVEL